MWLSENTDYIMPCDAALTFGMKNGERYFYSYLYINNQLVLCWNQHASHHGHAGGINTIIVGKGQVIKYTGNRDIMKYFPMK